jgi:hypothetical protein
MKTVKFRSPLENSDTHREEPSDYPDLPPTDAQKPLPLRYVLTRPVLISVANYAALALLGMVAFTLMPLIWSTPVEYGGLDMSPAPIGVWLSVFGCMNGIFQFAVFPHAVARFGPRWVFITCIGVFAVVYAMFPFENLLRRTADSSVWPLILLQLTALSISDMGYSKPFCDFLGVRPDADHAAHRFCQAPCLCIWVPPRPTSDHLARRMVSHSRWPRSNARLRQLSRVGFLLSPSRIMSWVGTLCILCFFSWYVVGCISRRNFHSTCGLVISGGYRCHE